VSVTDFSNLSSAEKFTVVPRVLQDSVERKHSHCTSAPVHSSVFSSALRQELEMDCAVRGAMTWKK